MTKQPKLVEPEEIEGPYELPAGWKWAKLGKTCEINPRDNSLKDLPDALEVTFVPMAAVDEEKGAIITPQIRQLKQVKKGYTQFKEGDIIFAKITPCMENGKAAMAINLKNGLGFGSTEFHVLRPANQTIPEYIYFYVRQPSFRNEAEMNMTGTAGQLRVPTAFMKNATIPLPTLQEQKRIVAVVEATLSRVNKAKEFLKESGKAIEKILPAAIKKVIPTEDPLPDGWKWVKLRDVAKIGREHINPLEYPDMEFNYLSIENIKSNTGKLINFSPTKGKKIKSAKLKFSTEDVLYSRLRPYLNKVYLPEFDGISATDLLPLKPLPAIDKEYLTYHLRSNFVVEYANSNMTGIQLPRIRAQKILEIPIPLPPPDEQKRIVAHLNQISGRVDKLKELHAQASERVEKIAASILTKAFRGEL